MSKKILGIRECARCGNKIEIYHKNRLEYKNVFCSKECEKEFKKSKDLNATCMNCGKKFHLKPYHLNKYKTHCCSKECFREYKKVYMKGEGNHQFGLKGSLNSSWRSDERISHYGYKQIRVLNHPFRDSGDFVFEHRLVAEKYLLTEENSVEIDGVRYLKEEYHVHHKDKNRLNNNVDNLEVLLITEHMKLHSKEKENKSELICLNCGDTYKVIKSRELTSKFCCNECRYEFQSKNKKGNNKKCPICKTIFYTTDKNRICCSVACSNEYNSRGTSVVKCSNCEADFKIKNSRLNKSENVFCSRKCYSEYKSSGK